MLQRKMAGARATGKVYLIIGCVGMRKANFISGGIQSAQEDGGSFFSHVFTGIGDETGNYMRTKYPFLLNNPKIPRAAKALEIIESEPEGVVCNPMTRYFNDDFQMHIYGRAFTVQEADAILLRAYAMVGDPYDYAEIAKHVFGIIPDSDRLKVCSSATSFYFELVERPVKADVVEGSETPKDVNEYLYPARKWDFFPYNIAMAQA
jgi:hypothetical protein